MDPKVKNVSYHALKTDLKQKTTGNQVEAVGTLLKQYPEIVDARYKEGLTCLMMAASQGNLALVKLFLEKKAHLDAEDQYKNTALLHAIKAKRVELAMHLLEQGADPHQQCHNSYNPMYLAYENFERHDFWPFMEALIKHGIDLNQVHSHGQTLLMAASDFQADVELLRFLLDRGANPNLADHDANTVLINACKRNHLQIIEVLLQRGANINQCACYYLRPGYSTHGDEDEGFNALMRAVHANNELIVRLLIARGADVNAPSINTTRGTFDGVTFGKTALQIALTKEHYSIAQLLLDAGADPSLKDHDGKSAQDDLQNGQIVKDGESASASNLNHSLMQEMAAENTPIEAQEWAQMLAAHQVFLENKTKGGSWQVLDASGLSLGVFQGASSENGTQLAPQFANLTGVNLKNQQLSYANLLACWGKSIDFRGSTLASTLLADAYLPNANFEGAVLTEADFSRSDLTNANFRNALIKGTDFEHCNLTGADFTGAQIMGATFNGAQIDQIKGIW